LKFTFSSAGGTVYKFCRLTCLSQRVSPGCFAVGRVRSASWTRWQRSRDGLSRFATHAHIAASALPLFCRCVPPQPRVWVASDHVVRNFTLVASLTGRSLQSNSNHLIARWPWHRHSVCLPPPRLLPVHSFSFNVLVGVSLGLMRVVIDVCEQRNDSQVVCVLFCNDLVVSLPRNNDTPAQHL
jgi:hypothetical protein